MGLDQYAYTKDSKNDIDTVKIAQWRKHNRLHGWMEEKFHQGDDSYKKLESVYTLDGDFNCVEMELTAKDLKELESVILDQSLPETGGFFFGGDSYENYEEHHKKSDLKFLIDARKAIQKGKKVYYNSWW